jgi:hypothetical protein
MKRVQLASRYPLLAAKELNHRGRKRSTEEEN